MKEFKHHYIKVNIEYIAEIEDVNINEIIEELRGSGSAKIIGVEAFSSDKSIYELDRTDVT